MDEKFIRIWYCPLACHIILVDIEHQRTSIKSRLVAIFDKCPFAHILWIKAWHGQTSGGHKKRLSERINVVNRGRECGGLHGTYFKRRSKLLKPSGMYKSTCFKQTVFKDTSKEKDKNKSSFCVPFFPTSSSFTCLPIIIKVLNLQKPLHTHPHTSYTLKDPN